MNIKNMYRVLLLLFAFVAQIAWAQAPVATPTEAITGLLNRIGGDGAADKFEIVIDASLAENGKDVFVITSQNGKPCIKGNTQLSVATGINWYLNHYAHINLTWNNLTTDLSQVTLPLPGREEKHVSSAKYRYDFNTCTFSYSMAFWTWERWQQEIDWMALHGVNAPLNLVGLDVVTRKFLQELKVSDSDINAYIAGPGFIAWFAMNNLEGWGGTINSSNTGVQMNGNPDWWYTRQEQLCRNMLQRMRELGMQPVIPGFSGQVPNCIVNYTINGFSAGDVVNNGTWAGGYTRPDILKPNSTSYATFAPIYYKHLHEVMGVSELYSMDPFHEGSLPSGVSNETCYPNIMAKLDAYHDAVDATAKANYNVGSKAKWIIQYWQGVPQSGAFSAMNSYGDRFIGLDLFADNIYAENAAKWRTDYYKGRPYIYCMLHNFGGRSGLHGRLETTMDGYFQALAKNNNCQGIGATPEGTETNPILYDMLFELPWMNSNPGADAWLEEYAHSRYGVQNEKALSALKNLKNSVWDCKVNQQGTSEAVILARPDWTVGSVSSWSTSAIYWDTQDVLQAADELYAIKDDVTANGGKDGITNYNYDFIDVVRQSMVDYAAQLLPMIKAAHDKGDNTEYTRLYQLYLQLMLDLDTMLSYDENFKLERWTSLARNIADEVDVTTENDRNWLEWNARTQVTVWSKGDTDLHDYSNRCWAGLIKDFHYKRWKHFFENNGNAPSGGWFSGFEYPWTVDFNGTYDLAGDYSKIVIPTDVTATEKAAQTFGNYFGRVKGATKNYIFPMGVTSNATKSGVIPEVYRGKTVELPLIIGKNVEVSSVWVDLNNDGAKGNGETLTASNNQVAIPAEATIGKTTAQVVYSDGTDITFNLALVEDITDARTVTAVAGANGSVAIEGTNALSITNTEAVKMTATANTGYNFKDWTDAAGNVVSNDNPFIYYGKEAATFTANFIQDKWGVPSEDKSDWNNTTVQTSFVNQITFAYHNREPEIIYEASVAPENLFNTIPQIINVPQGASFDISWSDDNNNGLKYCYLSAYYDYDGDGVFELLETKGKRTPELVNDGSNNLSVCEGKINVLLPYDAPLGITHMRLRFDGGWKTQNFDASTKAYDAKAQLNRMCYEVVINVTEKSDKAATINVETNNANWGTVEVWTDETPDGSTGTTWNVSANIPMYLRATKANDDVEFLGWYDHYGRLLTENLEHKMYAREDATYTAKFQALDIDGWLFEYRTEPDTEITTKLANGVKPEAGKTYYIYAPTRPTNNGEYVNRYLYNNSGTLTLSTTESTAASYLWKCGVENGKYTFQNVADPAKYLKHKGLANAPYGFELGTGTTYYEGITLQSVPGDGETRNLFFVINDDGSGFNQSTRAHNQSTEDYTTDFVFTEVYTPYVVILTDVRKSGNNDLVIPETVDILGEQCKIVGFDNGVFNNNKDLWSITMPKSMEFLSEKSLFNHTLTGNGNTQTFDVDIKNNEGWRITMDVERTGMLTGWGACLLASGDTPAKGDYETYAEGFQFYLQCTEKGAARDKLIIKTKEQIGDNWYFDDVYQEEKFTVIIEYNGAQQLSVNVLKADGTNATNHNGKQEPIVFTDCTIQDIKQLCTNVQAAITANVKIDKTPEANPFSGCSNLVKIAFDGTCANYYVDENGDLYNSNNELVCSPEGKAAKDVASHELAELIEKMETLTAQVATYNPVGKANKIELQTTNPNAANYLWTNNTDKEEGSIAHLVDGIKGNDNNFFHSNWHSVSTPEGYHFIEVDLGADFAHTMMQFAYHTRTKCSNDFPDAITVMGSNDKTNYTDIHTESGNLPQAVNKNFTSAVFDCEQRYRYLRFKVEAERTYWHMGEFELYNMTSTADVFPVLESGITNEQAATAYDALLKATYVFNMGKTAQELQTAKTALQSEYDKLNELFKAVIPVVLTTDVNSPQLYIIKTKRDNAPVFNYLPTSNHNFNLVSASTGAAAQAFYFVLSDSREGINIYPYAAGGKVLAANDVSNGAEKVFAAEKGSATHEQWKFVKQTDGYYNLQPINTSTYLSNFGGTSNKLGFYNSNPQSDGGSLFQFVETTVEGSAIYNTLKLHHATTSAIAGSDVVGYYNKAKADDYNTAYAHATSILGTSTQEDQVYADAYNALLVAYDALEINMPENGKAYVIKLKYTGNGRQGYKYMNVGDDKTITFVADAESYPQTAYFVCRKDETTGRYYFVPAQIGGFLSYKSIAENYLASTCAWEVTPLYYYGNKNNISNKSVENLIGHFCIKIDNRDPNDEQDWAFIVNEGTNKFDTSTEPFLNGNYTSAVQFEEVTKYTINKPTHTPVIKEQNPLLSGIENNQTISTFSAPYATVMPEGVTAYYAQKAYNGNTLYLTAMEEGLALPAGQGVILIGSNVNAAAIVPATTEERAEINEGNNFFKSSAAGDVTMGENDYILAKGEQGIGIYKAKKDTKLKAGKAYLSFENAQQAKSFVMQFGGTPTGIENTLLGTPNAHDAIYDLSGRRVNTITKGGLYIVNGKKVFIK